MARKARAFSIIILLVSTAAFARTADEPRRELVTFFASERILGSWIKSYFNSIPGGEANFNECEASIGEALASRGYAAAAVSFSEDQRASARRYGTVFKRYNDVSMMPNETLVRASSVVDNSASVVLACRAVVEKPGWRSGGAGDACASARCKAVDTASRRRIATASGVRCSQPGEGEGGRIRAIRQACIDMVTQIQGRLAER